MLKNILSRIEQKWALTSDERLINYWKKKGVKIGNGIYFHNRKMVHLDLLRPSLISIGDNVVLNKNLNIICHDVSFRVFREVYNDFLPGWGKVTIGNNVYISWNCSLLKGAEIGNNCIIGFGSVVMGKIPNNSVAAGIPAKVICTLEEYYQKRKIKCIEESFEYARSIKERYDRKPKISEFWDEYPLFLNGDETHAELPYSAQFHLKEGYETYKKEHKAVFKGFDDFLKHAGL